MMRSPFLTLSGIRLPVSVLIDPSPTASMVPDLGFSLPLSGRKMPLAVLVSGSSRRTRTLSPRGRTDTLVLVEVFDISSVSNQGVRQERKTGITTEARRHREGSCGEDKQDAVRGSWIESTLLNSLQIRLGVSVPLWCVSLTTTPATGRGSGGGGGGGASREGARRRWWCWGGRGRR